MIKPKTTIKIILILAFIVFIGLMIYVFSGIDFPCVPGATMMTNVLPDVRC